MPRRPRIVVPGLPHHVTQRGARRGCTFHTASDYEDYLALLRRSCLRHGVTIWAYCLMPNHIHLIAVPATAQALSLAVGRAHKRYAELVNAREKCTGHLWQDRYFSCVMDEAHTLMAARYIERNPVAGGLAEQPEDWQWSSARRHLDGTPDPLLGAAPLLDLVPDWRGFLATPGAVAGEARLEEHLNKGAPLGSDGFLRGLEARLGRAMRIVGRGRPPTRRPENVPGTF